MKLLQDTDRQRDRDGAMLYLLRPVSVPALLAFPAILPSRGR